MLQQRVRTVLGLLRGKEEGQPRNKSSRPPPPPPAGPGAGRGSEPFGRLPPPRPARRESADLRSPPRARPRPGPVPAAPRPRAQLARGWGCEGSARREPPPRPISGRLASRPLQFPPPPRGRFGQGDGARSRGCLRGRALLLMKGIVTFPGRPLPMSAPLKGRPAARGSPWPHCAGSVRELSEHPPRAAPKHCVFSSLPNQSTCDPN